MLIFLLLLSALLLIIAYRFYGRFLERRCGVDSSRTTPACEFEDGVDYVPTRPSVLFGHHFSSIAGAGPIVGPIIAASVFGWLPTWIWIIAGSIFVGGVHDFGSTLMSLRYKGRSITSTSRQLVGERTGSLFLLFVLIALIYVIIVFLDLTVTGFVNQPAVATSSGWFILVALAFGWFVRRSLLPYKLLIPIFIVLTYVGLWVGFNWPAPLMSKNLWMLVVLAYCYCAAILPVSTLMQPRDFLSATFLYAIMLLGLIGICAHGGGLELPMYTSFAPKDWSYLVPFLFITVACGACSGFLSDCTNRHAFTLNIESSVVAESQLYKRIALDLIFRSTQLQQIEFKGGHILDRLYGAFYEHCIQASNGLDILPQSVQTLIDEEQNEEGRLRRLCDYTAGLTDGQAVRTYKRLFDADFGSIAELL